MIAVGFLLLSYLVVRPEKDAVAVGHNDHSENQAGKSGESRTRTKLTEEKPTESEPNLVFRRIAYLPAYYLDEYLVEGRQVFHRPGSVDSSSVAVVAEISNEFSISRKVAVAEGITAQISYKPFADSAIQVNRGAWLSRANRVDFDVNDLEKLIIVVIPDTSSDPFAFIFLSEYDRHKDITDIVLVLDYDFYHVEVRLISEAKGKLYQKFDLNLAITRKPEFKVDVVPVKELTAKEIREQLEAFLHEGNELFKTFPIESAIKLEQNREIDEWEKRIVRFISQYPDKFSVAIFLSDIPPVQYKGAIYGPNWPSLNRLTTRLARLKDFIDELRKS